MYILSNDNQNFSNSVMYARLRSARRASASGVRTTCAPRMISIETKYMSNQKHRHVTTRFATFKQHSLPNQINKSRHLSRFNAPPFPKSNQ